MTADIARLNPEQWSAFLEGYSSGYCAGLERGRQLEHDEVATLQRESARIVHAMAKIPPRDRDEDRACRERIDARFNQGGAA